MSNVSSFLRDGLILGGPAWQFVLAVALFALGLAMIGHGARQSGKRSSLF